MWVRSLKKRYRQADGRVRLLAWATLFALISGMIGFGEPLDYALHVARAKLLSHPSDGSVVMVAIDDESLAREGAWPWPDAKRAALFRAVNKAGAKKILYDFYFAPGSPPIPQLTAAIKEMPGKVVLPTAVIREGGSVQSVRIFPPKSLIGFIETGDITHHINDLGQASGIRTCSKYNGKVYRSFASILADYHGPCINIEIDPTLNLASIPVISSYEVLNGDHASVIRGKYVVIAPFAEELRDIATMAGYYRRPAGYVHVIGGDTIKHSMTFDIGWLIPMLFGLLVSYVSLFNRSEKVKIAVGGSSIFVFSAIGILQQSFKIDSDVTAAIILCLIVQARRTWLRVRQKGGTINLRSGLPNFLAMTESKAGKQPLIVARIGNYAEIVASLSPALQQQLVDQIIARLSLGISGASLYHSEEGFFAWFAEETRESALGDQLDGLHALMSAPVALDGRTVDLAITFGVDGDTQRSVQNRVGSAMLAAEEAAREYGRWSRYDSTRLADAEWKLSLLGQLDHAIEAGQVWVAYQPKYCLRTGVIDSAEALVRWSHPEKGAISPDEFVAVAEHFGRIEKLTMHVVVSALEVVALFDRHGTEFSVAVNLSASLLDNDYMAHSIAEAIRQAGVDPSRLIFEVTETAATSSSDDMPALLARLEEMGVGISIDDYGTGYSTLEYLRRIPAKEIKIDRSFISSIEQNQSDRVMVNSTIQLAHQLNRKVVAEGVESMASLEILRSMGCDYAQGYLISRPLRPRALARKMLRQNQKLAA